jgi:hypothetical protein
MIEYILLSDASQCLERLLKKSLILGGSTICLKKRSLTMTYRCDRVMFQPSQMTAPPPLCYRNMRLTNHKQSKMYKIIKIKINILAHHVWKPGHMKVMSVQCGSAVPGDANV